MTKLTDEELREPNVTLVIPENRSWQIPKAVMEELRLFGGRYHNGNWIVSVPAYRYRYWLNLAQPKAQPHTREAQGE